MKSINFNTGVKKYAINDDENNFVSVNINDMNIANRFRECENLFDEIEKDVIQNGDPTPEKLAEYDKTIKEKIDYIFNADVSSHAFGKVNCLSPVGEGKVMFTAFLEAFMELIAEDVKKMKAESGAAPKNTVKYMPPEQKKKSAPKGKKAKGSLDPNNLSEEQLTFLKALFMEAMSE